VARIGIQTWGSEGDIRRSSRLALHWPAAATRSNLYTEIMMAHEVLPIARFHRARLLLRS
jgi:hypothetical protein